MILRRRFRGAVCHWRVSDPFHARLGGKAHEIKKSRSEVEQRDFSKWSAPTNTRTGRRHETMGRMIASAEELGPLLGEIRPRMSEQLDEAVGRLPFHKHVRKRDRNAASEPVGRANDSSHGATPCQRIDEQAKVIFEACEQGVIVISRLDRSIRIATTEIHPEVAGVRGRQGVRGGSRPVGAMPKLVGDNTLSRCPRTRHSLPSGSILVPSGHTVRHHAA